MRVSARASSGSPTANPTTTKAIIVVVYSELADSRCSRRTTKGIAACSAGAKNCVSVEMRKLSPKRIPKPTGKPATNGFQS